MSFGEGNLHDRVDELLRENAELRKTLDFYYDLLMAFMKYMRAE